MSTPPRPARVSVLMVLFVLALAAPAYAGTATYDTGVVTFAAADGEANALSFTDDGGNLVRVTDAVPVTAGTGCTQDGDAAVCGDGNAITQVVAGLGDGDDSATTSLGAVPVSFDGGPGNDTLTGGDGADTLSGGDDNDLLDGGAGADVLDGQGGTDEVTYASRSADVTVSLNGAADDGEAGEGDNVTAENVTTGSGNDTLTGDGNDNRLVAGAGNDTIDGGGGADYMDGGADRDIVSYAGRIGGVTVSLNGAADDGAPGEGDNAVNMEDIAGGDGDDDLTGDGGPNAISGNGGADTLHGGGGADTLNGGEGADTLLGGDGADLFSGGAGEDAVSYADHADAVAADLDGAVGDDGNAADGAAGARDTINSDVEDLTGTAGDDLLAGDAGPNKINGGAGGDFIGGGDGNDILNGGSDNDTISGGNGDDQVNGDAGHDLLDGELGNDQIDGGPGIDFVSYSGRSAPVVASLATSFGNGQAGENDSILNAEALLGGVASDTLTGDAGPNYIDGQGGNDTVTGGSGVDTLYGNDGNDLIKARDGAADLIGCGSGADYAEVDTTETYTTDDCETRNDGTATPPPGGGGGGGGGGTGGFPTPGADGTFTPGAAIPAADLLANVLANVQVGGIDFNNLQSVINAATAGTPPTADAVTAATAAATAASNASRSAAGTPRSHPRGLKAKLSVKRVVKLPAKVVASGQLSPATKVGKKACGSGGVRATISLPKGKSYTTTARLSPTCSYRLVLKLTRRMHLRRDTRVVLRFLGNSYQLPFTLRPALRLRVG